MNERAKKIEDKISKMISQNDEHYARLDMKNGDVLFVVQRMISGKLADDYDLYKGSMSNPRYRLLSKVELASIANDINDKY